MTASSRMADLLARWVPALATLVFGAAGGILGPLLPSIARSFGMPWSVAGLLLAATYAGSITSVGISGYLADRCGKKAVFLVGLAGLGLACVLLAASPTFAVAFLSCLLIGGAGGTLEGLCSAIIADQDPAHTDRNMNWLQVAFSAGAAGAIVLTAHLLAAGASWRWSFGALGAVIAGLLVAGCCMRLRPAPPAPPISPRRALRVVLDPPMLLLALAIALYVGSEMSLASWISPMLERGYALPPSVTLYSAGLFWLLTGVGRLAVGAVAHRYPGLTLLRVLVVGGLLAYACLLLPFGRWPLWIGSGLAGLTFSGIWPLIISLGSARHPAYSGTAVAMLVAAGTLGAVGGPAAVGWLLERSPTPAAALQVMALLFGGLALAVWRYRPGPPAAVAE